MLSGNIRELRKKAGLSQEQAAEMIGVSRQAITKWETDGGLPDLENVVALARLFGVTVDELLGSEGQAAATAPEHEPSRSVTQCDAPAGCDFDIDFGCARSVSVVGATGERVRLVLSSEKIEDVESAFKVAIDAEGKSFDVEVNRTDQATDAQARASLDILIELPAAWENHVELSGNADAVSVSGLSSRRIEVGGQLASLALEGVSGHVELDAKGDAQVTCATLPSRLDVNHVRATSRVLVPAGAAFATRTRGIGNRIVLDNVEETPDAECKIELNGMRNELTIAPSK